MHITTEIRNNAVIIKVDNMIYIKPVLDKT